MVIHSFTKVKASSPISVLSVNHPKIHWRKKPETTGLHIILPGFQLIATETTIKNQRPKKHCYFW